MHFVKKKPKQKRLDFVKKLKKNRILRISGAYNPLTNRLNNCVKIRVDENTQSVSTWGPQIAQK